ncbi:MAG: methylated-DNA--[protein]-cysteine S-methyltransferase [Arcobacteraceae bacterium]
MRSYKDKSITQAIIHTTIVQTPLGEMFAASTAKGVCLLCFYDKFHIDAHLKNLKERFNAQVLALNNDYFIQLQQELDEYFQGKRTCFTLPLQLLGTTFQIKCWKALLTIEYGKTISYKEEAQKIDNPKAYRAVANANSQNMIEIIVPCHRVIQADGKLGGYSSGIDKKIFLLDLEKESLNKN